MKTFATVVVTAAVVLTTAFFVWFGTGDDSTATAPTKSTDSSFYTLTTVTRIGSHH